MKKVLIITYSFPPKNNIAARRFGELSPYLIENNWEPIILTTNSEGTLPTKVSSENIIRYGTHPQKSLEISKGKDKGKFAKLVRLKRDLGFNFRVFDRTYYNWYKPIKESNLLSDVKVDLIVASFGPGAALFLGNYYSKKFGVPWIADFRDLGALYKDPYYKQNFLAKILDRTIERKVISTSSAITSIGTTLTELLQCQYNKPSFSIFNGWDEEAMTTRNDYIDTNNIIYYAGRLYPHQMQSLFILIRALKIVNSVQLVMRSLGPQYLNEKIMEFARNNGIENRVKILEPVDQKIVYRESEKSLVNLVVEDLDKTIYWKKGTLTGKLLGLLPMSPPILSITRADSEIGEILNLTSKGKVCSTVEEIVEFFDGLKNSKYSGNDKINFYSKKQQAILLADIFEKVIRSN